jgi:flagellar motor switch/type III secretory pathway protein FliN
MSSSTSSSSSSDALAPLGWVLDVPCAVEFILGTTTVRVADCARLEPQSVVALQQAAGADVQLRVGGVPLAEGEVIVLERTLSLRLTRMLPPAERDFS